MTVSRSVAFNSFLAVSIFMPLFWGCMSSQSPSFAASGEIAKMEKNQYSDEMFFYALSNISTSPDYLLVTIRYGVESPPRHVCVGANFFRGAIHMENRLSYDEAGFRQESELTTDPRHVFVFKSADAIRNTTPPYSEDDLMVARKTLVGVTREALKRDWRTLSRELNPAAFAHIALEYGLMVHSGGCFYGGPAPYELSDVVERDRQYEQSRESEQQKAKAMIDSMRGVDRLRQSFKFEREPSLGWVNMEPESLNVDLVPLNPGVIGSASWWNTIHEGKPKYDWYDFIAYFSAAESVLSRHRWLNEFKKLSGDRSVDVRLYGLGVANESPALNEATELWRQAGLRGAPYGQVFARCGHGWTTMFFGKEDDRLLVDSSRAEGRAPLCAVDRLEISWSAGAKPGEPSSRYAIINPDGSIKERFFPSK